MKKKKKKNSIPYNDLRENLCKYGWPVNFNYVFQYACTKSMSLTVLSK